MSLPAIDDIKDTFSFLTDWEDRYRYIIELGRLLPPMDDALKTEATKVRGCTSQVWLVAEKHGPHWHFIGDSDAAIVKGLVAILLALYSSTPIIRADDAKTLFTELGLQEHLSPSRSNGFFAMVQRIEVLANAPLAL